MMILAIAWRNIWRNKTRSWVVIGSILVGIWAILFMLSFSFSLAKGYVEKSIRYQTSHIQLHHPDWIEDKEVKYMLSNGEEVLRSIENLPNIQTAVIRTNVNGMVRSSRGARGTMIKGVRPSEEAKISQMDQKITQGSYFTEKRRNEIIIAEKLAEKLKLKLRKKLVLQFQDASGDIVAGSFRVVGLFSTANTQYDESFVMVNQKDLNRILGEENASHELAVFLDKAELLDSTMTLLKSQFPDLSIRNYREISPDVKLYETQIDTSATIFIFIFMLALIFGIINTMLMAVLERNKELGMLMALGMNKPRVFSMIVLETLLLGFIALPLGLAASWLSIKHFSKVGIDLSAFSQGIEQFGIDTIIYNYLPNDQYLTMAMAVLMTALLGSLYPAVKAIKLKPVEAMRKI